MLIHVVYFWLNDNAPAGERERLAEGCRSLLGKIPGVRHLWAGGPADTPKRPVIDDSYSVGLCVILDDMAGHDVYQEHPLHMEFIARHKEHWKRVQIYDSQG
ncbi:MAG: Stress responsive alpha-beta barrel domain protein [Phycisphaerales bacterium]|nr:Stress responsive alpha-beta barrel domain protein [Phycisphaerales bacterium]